MTESARQKTSLGQRERAVFLEALEQPTATERLAYLERACAGDHSLRAAVEALLANHQGDDFLETPALGTALLGSLNKRTGRTTACLPVIEKTGDCIGRYKLLQKIGEGGCGIVYMAEQEQPVRRKVALKIIKLGMDTKQVTARFDAERQALALMDHPNIAKVLDAGATDAGRPYFVMELVRGIRITEFCDENSLSTEERLRLFVAVCHAIQHAHQKGIIHRDIKPSNILVTLHDGVPVPKVIDFGIAKATAQRLTEMTLFTDFQAFIGTPAYTSPEQAEMSGLDIDTRSDIYSLGVLLYQLLTGQTPFDPGELMQCNLDEMRRIIREEEPQRPSTRLSTLGMAEATVLCRTRQAKMPVLVQAVRGDLDWIVMKCLEKDRNRRYETANALAVDILRYVQNEPVLARPPSAVYKISKFVRRNRTTVFASVTVALVLTVGVFVSTWLAIRATQAEHEESRLHRAMELAFIWDVESHQELAALRGHLSEIYCLAVSSDGRIAVSGCKDGTLLGWDCQHLAPRTPFEKLPISVESVCFFPANREMLTINRDHTVSLWNCATLQEVEKVPSLGVHIRRLVTSPDGTRLYAGTQDGGVKVLDWVTRLVITNLPPPKPEHGRPFGPRGGNGLVGLADQGRTLVVEAPGPSIRLLDTSTWQLRGEWKVGEEPPFFPTQTAPLLSPDSRFVVMASHGEAAVFHSLINGQTEATVPIQQGRVSAMAFSADGKLFATSSIDGTVNLWDCSQHKLIDVLRGHLLGIEAVAFSSDGQRLATTSHGNEAVKIWDLTTRHEVATLAGEGSLFRQVQFSPDGKLIEAVNIQGDAHFWRAPALEEINP